MRCLGSGRLNAKQKARTVLHPQRVGQRLGGDLNFVPIGVGESRLCGELCSEGDDGWICHACELAEG